MALTLQRSGLHDWVLQRITAVYLLIYLFGTSLYFVANSPPTGITYEYWHATWQLPSLRYATFIMVLCVCCHAWIGVWTIMTDYVKNIRLRMLMQFSVMLTLIINLLWAGDLLLWGTK